jgi:hypothetical protein
MPTRRPGAAEVLLEELSGPCRLVTGEVQRNDLSTVGQQRVELARAGLGPKGARHDPDERRRESALAFRRPHAACDGLDDGGRIQSVRTGHEQRAETQLESLEPLGGGILHRLSGHALARGEIDQRLDRAVVAA